MNTYTYTFGSECPNDGEMILYTLQLTSREMIYVEHIKAHAALYRKGFGEHIAASFFDRFKCHVTLDAVHQGVHARHCLG